MFDWGAVANEEKWHSKNMQILRMKETKIKSERNKRRQKCEKTCSIRSILKNAKELCNTRCLYDYFPRWPFFFVNTSACLPFLRAKHKRFHCWKSHAYTLARKGCHFWVMHAHFLKHNITIKCFHSVTTIFFFVFFFVEPLLSFFFFFSLDNSSSKCAAIV